MAVQTPVASTCSSLRGAERRGSPDLSHLNCMRCSLWIATPSATARNDERGGFCNSGFIVHCFGQRHDDGDMQETNRNDGVNKAGLFYPYLKSVEPCDRSASFNSFFSSLLFVESPVAVQQKKPVQFTYKTVGLPWCVLCFAVTRKENRISVSLWARASPLCV